MRELAKLCNVSISTVSKSFCDAEDVSKETKELVFKTAKQYGCFGKFYKGKYHKKIIAVICAELSDYYSIFVRKLQECIEKDDGICLISTFNFSAAKQAELIEYYASFLRVDGIIVFTLKQPLKKGYDVPIVSIFSSVDQRVDSVNTNLRLAIDEAFASLYSLGHRRFAFLGEELTRTKASCIEDSLRSLTDCSCTFIESDKRFEEAGADGIDRLMRENTSFTAVICAYDNIAFGAIKQLKSIGLHVPEDVSVIGMDNIDIGRFTETSLSTVDTTPDDICRITWDLLSKKIQNKYFRANQNLIINPRFIQRESIGKAKE